VRRGLAGHSGGTAPVFHRTSPDHRPLTAAAYIRCGRRESLALNRTPQEEVDALGLYLFADSDEGREAVRGIDQVVSDMPGLEGLTLLEDAIDEAVERARRKPGWGGAVALAGANDSPVSVAPAVSAAS